MLKRSTLIPLAAAAAALALAGCNGPTKAGLDARAEARERINVYSAQFTYDQAKQDFETGQFDRALKNITVAMEQAPDVAEFSLLEGRIYLERNELENAVSSFLRAIELDDQLAEAHYYAGIVFQRWSDDDAALDHYSRAFEIDSANVHYLLASAEAMIALGEFENARSFVEGRLDYFEHNAALRHLLGQVALLQGDPTTAAGLYEEARLLEPENLQLLEELAWVQYEAGLYAPCLESVQLLQSKAAKERMDLTHLEARCLMMLGRSTDAHAIYQTLTRRQPANESVWIEFCSLAWKLGDFRRVAECSAHLTSFAPHRFEGHMFKGLYQRHEGNLDTATTLLRQAADLAADSVLPHLLLGRTLEEAGAHEQALIAYDEALRLQPENAEARKLHSDLKEKLRVATAG